MIQPVKEKIILGIDPGTTIMGYGLLKITGTKPQVITMGVIDLRNTIIIILSFVESLNVLSALLKRICPMNWPLKLPFLERMYSPC